MSLHQMSLDFLGIGAFAAGSGVGARVGMGVDSGPDYFGIFDLGPSTGSGDPGTTSRPGLDTAAEGVA